MEKIECLGTLDQLQTCNLHTLGIPWRREIIWRNIWNNNDRVFFQVNDRPQTTDPGSQKLSRRNHTKKSTLKSIKNTDKFFKSHGDEREKVLEELAKNSTFSTEGKE